MGKIDKLWFSGNRIFILTQDGLEKSRPLEAFPRLMDASDAERHNFQLMSDEQSIRWDNIDEDIHILSFDDTAEPNYDNEVAKMLELGRVIDFDDFAIKIGMSKSKLDRFRYGIWTPSGESLQKIKDGLRHYHNLK